MKKIASIATIAAMSFAGFLQSADPIEFLSNPQARCGGSSRSKCKVPSGSYYTDSTSEVPLQEISSAGVPIHFSGTNAAAGVTLSEDGNSIIVPKRGYYQIEWNVALFGTNQIPDFGTIPGTLNLQKNGNAVTLLHPIPQVPVILYTVPVGDGDPAAFAASVIVPLCAQDEISLLLSIDGSEGAAVVTSAQISAQFISGF